MKLRTLRQLKGLTQEQLALKSGVHQVTISRYERGMASALPRHREALEKALGVVGIVDWDDDDDPENIVFTRRRP
jgi:transcriptional regulator with XRE-family HTH domain